MKLRANSNHQNVFWDRTMKDFFQRALSFSLTISLISGFIVGGYSYYKNCEHVVVVAENVRNSVYLDNSYLKYSNFSINEKEDFFITDKTLANINKLHIDTLETVDFSFLSHCTNLSELVIENAQELTELNINDLNQLPSHIRVELQFDTKYIRKKGQKKLDLSSLSKEYVTVAIDSTEELDYYLLYSYLQSAKDEWYDYMTADRFRAIDEKLNYLLKQIDFSDITCEMDTFLRLVAFVGSYIQYDESVSLKGDVVLGSQTNDLSKEYNQRRLSFILDSDENEVLGICCNYAALLSALCYKIGIESYYVRGVDESQDSGHAWNLVKVDGNWFFVDVTRLDTSYEIEYYTYRLNALKKNTKANRKTELSNVTNRFKRAVLQDVSVDQYDKYKITTDIESLMTPASTLDSIVWYNQDAEGMVVNYKGIDIESTVIGFLLGFGVGFGSQLTLEEKMIRQRKRLENN
ncbi:MAG: hypothetical protein K2M17_04300 [Bacilli bacterium]|nr:hypothetical protein [Bacilli bacterium]